MQKILKNEDLIPGEWYWCRGKEPYHEFQIHEVMVLIDDSKYIGNRVWAMDNNSQALEIFDIYGPIPKPYVEIQLIDVKSYKCFWVNKIDIGNNDLYYKFTGQVLEDGYLVVDEYLFEKYHRTINFPNPSQIVYTKYPSHILLPKEN
jgi:hypothetical protein